MYLFVRSSETVRLIDLLDEAKVRMRDSLNTRNIEGKTNLSSEDMARAAEIIVCWVRICANMISTNKSEKLNHLN